MAQDVCTHFREIRIHTTKAITIQRQANDRLYNKKSLQKPVQLSQCTHVARGKKHALLRRSSRTDVIIITVCFCHAVCVL